MKIRGRHNRFIRIGRQRFIEQMIIIISLLIGFVVINIDRLPEDLTAEILCERMHINVGNAHADCSGILFDHFIMYMVFEIFKKETDRVGGLVIDLAGSEVFVHQVVIGNKRLDRLVIKIVDERQLIFNGLRRGLHASDAPRKKKADEQKLQDHDRRYADGKREMLCLVPEYVHSG